MSERFDLADIGVDVLTEEQEEAGERRQEMRDELRIEHDRQIDDDVRRAEAGWLGGNS